MPEGLYPKYLANRGANTTHQLATVLLFGSAQFHSVKLKNLSPSFKIKLFYINMRLLSALITSKYQFAAACWQLKTNNVLIHPHIL